MKTGVPPSGRNDASLDQAAAWLARLNSDRAVERDHIDFEIWMQADPCNAEAWRQTTMVWAETAAFADAPELARFRTAVAVTTRAAARRRRMAAYAAMAAAVVAFVGADLVLRGPISNVLPVQSHAAKAIQYATGVGDIRRVVLEDGSILTLDTDSAVAVRLGAIKREVVLTRGRARFEVAHDQQHPFIVEAGGRTVTALGTVFDVRVAPDAVNVVLVEGRVKIADLTGASASAIMDRGHQMLLPARGTWRESAIDPAQASIWTDGRLAFNDAPLSQVVAEMNRYSTRRLVIADDHLGARPIGGVFRAGDEKTLALALEAGRIARITDQPNGDRLIVGW
jgi:transmembrane sensor